MDSAFSDSTFATNFFSQWILTVLLTSIGFLLVLLTFRRFRNHFTAAVAPLSYSNYKTLSVIQGFYENAPTLLGIFYIDGNDIRHIFDNPAGARFWASDGSATSGRTRTEMGSDQATTELWVKKCVESLTSRSPVRFRFSTNDKRWFTVTVCPVARDVTNRQRFCYLAEDISDLKQKEEALQESNRIAELRMDQLKEILARLHLAEQAGRIGITEWNIPADSIEWCEHTKELYGLESGPSVRTFSEWIERIHPDDRALVKTSINDLLKARESSLDLQFRIILPSGEVRWISKRGNIVYNEQGTPTRCITAELDTTAWKESEERARLNQERLELALESGRLGLWDWDIPTGRVVYGGRWAAMLGYRDDEIAPSITSWERLVHPEDVSGVLRVLHEHLQGRTPFYEAEMRLRTKQEAWLWVLARGRVTLREQDNRAIRAVGVHIDVHEQRALREKLQEADRRKDNFLATLAHELRNPLAPIRTGLQIIKRDPNSPQAAQARDMMDRQLSHLVRLIDDLLDVSRISLGKIELRKSSIDLKTVIETAIEGSMPAIDAAGHTLMTHLPSEHARVYGDLTRLAQVVSNLLNNSAKYTPSRGRIELRGEVRGNSAIITVSDNGLGIPENMLGEIFNMFGQVNRTLARSQEGLGIGLALVRTLVEMHGGTVEARSPGLGQGATFTVTLPLDKDASEQMRADPVAESVPHATAGKRVLVVDDNKDGAESLALFLKMLGHEPTVAHSGEEALEEIPVVHPDVVFLDIGLPQMDGYEVARRMRATSAGADTKLVAITGWGAEKDKRLAQEAGFDAHLTKPVDLAAVERFMGGAGG